MAPAQAHAMVVSPDDPLNRDGLCVLSLDGGGVRGLSTLLILKSLMAKVNAERVKDGKPTVKPCELFDLIGGTSTGGIIAIMLGRLEMDIQECIDAYTDMFKSIFGKKGLPVNRWGKIKGRFDSIVLEECIRKILEDNGQSQTEPLNDGRERCKVAVCAKAAELTTTVLLRSYTSDDALNNIPASICEAARATSAATSFFEPVTIGPRGRRFVDGALGANNPSDQLWNEAQNVWCKNGEIELGDLLKCFVSIGTGNPGTMPIAEGSLRFLSETLVGIATQTEDTAKLFVGRHRRLYETKRYFRFNVQQGLQNVGLEEYKAAGLIDAATAEYMDGQEVKSAAQKCALNLKQKQTLLDISAVEEIIMWRNLERKTNNSAQQAITFMPFEQNEDIVNREAIFKDLDLRLTASSRNRSVAIWGLGGCGKTQIALEYAYRCQKKTSCSIFWIHADSEARFTQDYSELAKIAALPSDLKGYDLLSSVKQWIQHQENWLLILDNADDLSVFNNTLAPGEHSVQRSGLHQFIPKASTGTVLWTSRDGSIIDNLVGVKQGVEVGAMNHQEALTLFRKLNGRDNTEPSIYDSQLLELLQRLPLAIVQAAAYIRRTKVSVQQYLKFFQESESRQLKLLSQDFTNLYRNGVPNSVMHTWLISMQQIGRESPCSEKILKTVAYFDNKGLPFELVRAAAGTTFGEDEILLAASRLSDYSFFQVQKAVDDGMPTYEQHRLVQLATRQSLTVFEASSSSGDALEIIAELFPDGTYGTWKECTLYLPHALKVLKMPESRRNNERASLSQHVGRYFWEQGRSDEAERLEVEVLELRKEVLGAKHPNTILAMANLASIWRQQGRSEEAERLEVEVLELRKEILGAKHPDTISAMANLASTWWQQGRSDEAERLNVEVLELQKEILGAKHPHTISAMANLSSTWWQQGRFDEAERLNVEVLELQKEILGAKHPDTIRAMSSLASTWWQQGRLDEAERLEVEVLELRKEILGSKHPNTILAMANLASTWWQQGRLDEAERLQVEVLELRKEILGAKHPDTIRAMSNLAKMSIRSCDTEANIEIEALSSISLRNAYSIPETPPKTSSNRLQKWTRNLRKLGKP